MRELTILLILSISGCTTTYSPASLPNGENAYEVAFQSPFKGVASNKTLASIKDNIPDTTPHPINWTTPQ